MLGLPAVGDSGAVERGRGWMHIRRLILGQCQPWRILFRGRGGFFWLFMMMTCFSGDIVTTCGSG